jgi:hypothetical protein
MPVVFLADKGLCAVSQTNFQGLSDPRPEAPGPADAARAGATSLLTARPQVPVAARPGFATKGTYKKISASFIWLPGKIQAAWEDRAL